MNGRSLYPSGSDKNLLYNNIRYVKPVSFLNEEQQQTRNLYYDNNPYSLNGQTVNRPRGIYNTGKNSNIMSREASQTSSHSQRSTRAIRTNGLKIAEKPKFLNTKLPERNVSQHSNHSRHSNHQNLDQSRRLFDRNINLQQQNRQLHQQNRQLRQQMRLMEQSHKRQISAIERKFNDLVLKTTDLQKYIEDDSKQWNAKFNQMQSVIKPTTPNVSSNNPLSSLVYSQPKSTSEITPQKNSANYLVKR